MFLLVRILSAFVTLDYNSDSSPVCIEEKKVNNLTLVANYFVENLVVPGGVIEVQWMCLLPIFI